MKFSKAFLAVSLITIFGVILTVPGNALGSKQFKPNGAPIEQEPHFPPQPFDQGGPDEFGYRWIDSDEPGGPIYNWIDITGNGTQLFMSDDDNEGPIAMGFTFNFYGNDFNTFNICSNGWASFTSTSTSYYNSSIPSSSAPLNLLAGFWDDLNPSSGGEVWYYTSSDSAIISWINVPHYGSGGPYTFQIIILSNGDIVYQYQNMQSPTDGATIGIQNGDGSIGLQVAYNQSYVHNEMAVMFTIEPEYDHDIKANSIDSPSGFMAVGDSYPTQASFKNNGANTESFDVGMTISRGGNTVFDDTRSVSNLEPGDITQVTFDNFTPTQAGDYIVSAFSMLSGDENNSNDTIRVTVPAFANAYYEDFEADNGMFEGNADWEWGTPTSGPNGAHSGTKLWATVLNGSYNSNTTSTLTSPAFQIGASAQLKFYHWYDIENSYDGGNVKISTDGGNSWQLIDPEGGYPGTSNSSNPLYPDPIYTGHGQGYWEEATFDLSAYSGNTVQFRFDFGADGSVTYPGWYIDDLLLLGGGMTGNGFIAGVVSDASTSQPIEGAVVRTGGLTDTTNVDGEYSFELFPTIYDVTASAQYYQTMTVEDVVVVEDETTYVDFELLAPEISVDDSPVEVFLAPGDTMNHMLNLANTGNGLLIFSTRIDFNTLDPFDNPLVEMPIKSTSNRNGAMNEAYGGSGGNTFPVTLDFGDEIFSFDPQSPTGDGACLGVEYDGVNFWVTGRDPDNGDIHKLHKFDGDGNYLQSYQQGTGSTWGWRDLAYDGANLYASDEFELAIIDPATGQKTGELPMPPGFGGGAAPCRGLAYDGGTDHFWTANWDSPLTEFDRDGNVINEYPNPLFVYGLAWDGISAGGPYLWVFSQDGGDPAILVSQFDPINGEYTGVTFMAEGQAGDLAGGASFSTEFDPSLGVIFLMVQSSFVDMVKGYEIGPVASWFTVDPSSGTIPAGDDMDLTLHFDASGDITPDSTYTATLTINHNTSDPTVSIPITMNTWTTGIDVELDGLPASFTLSQNYPNPFNPTTVIEYALPRACDVNIEVFNIAGQKVKTLVDSYQKAGYREISWDGTDNGGNKAASGIYLYRLKAGDIVMTKRMSLIK